MISLPLLPPSGESVLNVLAVGAHPDDLEIGCGATIAALVNREQIAVKVHWLVLSGTPVRAEEARAAADDLLASSALSIEIAAFPDGYFPQHWAAIKQLLAEKVAETQPHLVFCPGQHDAHQDHRLVGELMWQTARRTMILEYEIPKWDSETFEPDVFVEAGAAAIERKLSVLNKNFKSQQDKPWFDDSLFKGLLRLRGVQCGSHSAEAFRARKTVLVV